MTGLSRTSLTRHAPSMREPDPAAARRAAREAYLASGGEVVLINKNWLNAWTDQKQLDLLAVVALGVEGEGK